MAPQPRAPGDRVPRRLSADVRRRKEDAMPDLRDPKTFENEVRRIARQLWPDAQFSGAAMLAGRERDGVFETEECVHLVEATTSRKKEKAKQDIDKLVKEARASQRRTPTKAAKGWFITRDEPTAEQREVGRKHTALVNIVSFAQFHAQLIDSRAYLSARASYPFGSVRDPASGDTKSEMAFVPLDMLRLSDSTTTSVVDVKKGLAAGKSYVLLGDYGAGKSMTLRHLFRELRDEHLRDRSSLFPVYLNLRDHYGQTDTAEVLERHARAIGFGSAHHLVRAWRAGYAILLIDGFDETTTLGIQGLWRQLKDNRYRAMEIVRRFIRENPSEVGLIVAGRAHFFDAADERKRSLGLKQETIELSLNEFTDEQIAEYLRKSGLRGSVPPWFPTRPLLVGYLVARGLLSEVVSEGSEDSGINFWNDPATGWDHLIDRISEREAEIEAGIDGSTIRAILERLASRARGKSNGVGPLTAEDVIECFSEVCGYQPDERGMVLLQRLPGLGVDRQDENTRAFIDEDYVDACRAGDVLRFIEDPFNFDSRVLGEVEIPLGFVGLKICTGRSHEIGCTASKLEAALRRAKEIFQSDHIPADIVRVMLDGGWDLSERTYIHGVFIGEFEIDAEGPNAANLLFQDCFFSRVELDPRVATAKVPTFQSCYIDELEGRISRADLPSDKFDNDSVIEHFAAEQQTTNLILDLDLPIGRKVMLTVLRKLYQRRGSGRKHSALVRGLDQRARRFVPDVLKLLQAEGLASQYRTGSTTIWLPDRGQMARVGKLISAPSRSRDSLLTKSDELS